jgi:hypothetical protein
MSSARDTIANLVSYYAEIIDTGNFDHLGRLFDHAYVECFVDGQSNGGRNFADHEIISWYRSSMCLYEGNPRTRHVITNLIIEVVDEQATAEARSYFTVMQCLPDFPLQIIAAGRYHDRFEKADDNWRFTSKDIHADYIGDISRHYPPLRGSTSNEPFPFVAS